MVVAHCIVPLDGQEAGNERLDYYHHCYCRTMAWQSILASLGIYGLVQQITVVHACPDVAYNARQKRSWRDLVSEDVGPCTQHTGWSATWYGVFVPGEIIPSVIKARAAERGISLQIRLELCEHCSPAPMEEESHE